MFHDNSDCFFFVENDNAMQSLRLSYRTAHLACITSSFDHWRNSSVWANMFFITLPSLEGTWTPSAYPWTDLLLDLCRRKVPLTSDIQDSFLGFRRNANGKTDTHAAGFGVQSKTCATELQFSYNGQTWTHKLHQRCVMQWSQTLISLWKLLSALTKHIHTHTHKHTHSQSQHLILPTSLCFTHCHAQLCSDRGGHSLRNCRCKYTFALWCLDIHQPQFNAPWLWWMRCYSYKRT